MSYPPVAIQILLALLVITAGVHDIRSRRIPNWLTLSGFVLGIVLNAFLGGAQGLWHSAMGIGLALLVYFPLYLLRAMGAGDVKLMAAVGATVGPFNWIGVFVLSAVLGGLIALALVIVKGRFRRTFSNMAYLIRELAHLRPPYMREELDVQSPKAVRLPHGAVVALGSLGFLVAAGIWAPR